MDFPNQSIRRSLPIGLLPGWTHLICSAAVWRFESLCYYTQNSIRAISRPPFHRENSLMLSRSIAVCSIVGLLALAAPLTTAQESLAWKFQSGETLKYVVTQNTDMLIELGGQKQTMTTNQKMDMVWKVGTVDSNGSAQMAQVVERVQMKSEGGPFGTVQFDSSDGKVPESPLVKSMVEVFKKIIGQEFGVTMLSTGKVEDVKVPQSLLDELAKSGAAGDAINKDVLKQMMTQSAVTLPEKAVKTNDAWEISQKIDMPFGTMSVTSVLTFKGIDSASGMAIIEMKPSVSVQPKDGAPITLTVTRSEGTGIVQFDKSLGRIVRSDLDLTLDLEIKRFGSQIKQTLHQKTAMELAR